jgi:hypothetical protein
MEFIQLVAYTIHHPRCNPLSGYPGTRRPVGGEWRNLRLLADKIPLLLE